jgi:hypothetical protein
MNSIKTKDEIEQLKIKRLEMFDKANELINSNCKMLMSGDETNAIPAYGWISPIEDLCYQLEELNYQYKKYGLRVILSQSKEKFGGLRFYTDIIETSPLSWLVTKINRIFNRSFFGMRYNTQTQKISATKNIFIYKIINFVQNIIFMIDNIYYLSFKNTNKRNVMHIAFDKKVYSLIRKAESECDDYCIRCGAHFSCSTKCQTTGWITYICEYCAKESELVYYKNGKKVKNNKFSKKEKKERKERKEK